MKYKWLKTARVAIALAFFFLIALVFLDFREVFNEETVRAVTFLQFVPSLLKFISIASLSAAGFIFIILLTILIGRVYCSAICPLGILQDFISRGSKIAGKRKKYRFRKPNYILQNAILILTLITGIFFTIIIVNFLDPYSIFGKIANQLFRPAGIWVNNAAAGMLESMNVYILYKMDMTRVHFSSLLISLILFTTVFLLSWKYGRLFCNSICPVGTVLGWLSRISLFRIHLDKLSCTQCGKCSFECKAECIDIKKMQVDNYRCVSCFNCLTVCEDSAIDLSIKTLKNPNNNVVEGSESGRKSFFISIFAGILSIAGFRKVKAISGNGNEPLNKKPTTVPVNKNYFVSPPGSLSIAHFTSVCTACQLCVSQCPTGVLQPSFDQFGITSLMQPFMNYDTNYCNFECTRCGEICPTGAIFSISHEEKITLQLGKVNFIKENCVVFSENTACGSCSEHCPTQAVRMVPYIDSLTIPETDNTICVGCGACEYACPVIPFKAIYVDGNPIHEAAKKPQQEKLKEPAIDEDFPF